MTGDVARTGSYAGPTTVLGAEVPAGITLHVGTMLETAFDDANFYPSETLVTATVDGTALAVYLQVDGDRKAVLDDDTPVERVLRTAEDFRAAFPDGDEMMNEAAEADRLDWTYNAWLDLYRETLTPAADGNRYTEHVDTVTHEISDGLPALIAEATRWLPVAALHHPHVAPETWTQVVLSTDPDVRREILDLPGCPEEARVAAALTAREGG